MEIVIIGTGNTATVLGRQLKAAKNHIVQVYGRDETAAKDLAIELDADATNNLKKLSTGAAIYIIAVSDSAIEAVNNELDLPGKIIVHTAAAISKNVLKNNDHFGVFYPLQSLKKETFYLPEIPVIIDANNDETLKKLQTLANSISKKVVTAGDEERLKIHTAAVFCNNFVNHLYSLAEDFCNKEGIDFSLMFPLIKETALRIENILPSAAQTGPALRNDTITLEKHLDILDDHPQLKELYKILTASIINRRAL